MDADERWERGFHGLEIPLRAFSGARAIRVVHPARQRIPLHCHDWPFLLLPALGGYSEICDGQRTLIAGPAAILHPAGTEHANDIGDAGLETISIQFDPAWLAWESTQLEFDGVRCWFGGPVAIAAKVLAAAWIRGSLPESALATRTAHFIEAALLKKQGRTPSWLGDLLQALEGEDHPSTTELARQLKLHPAWLARAYRIAAGEGLHEMLRRRRVERATTLLRQSDTSLAEVAAECGFCDQSHMNRAFRILSGRSPLVVRREREDLLSLCRPHRQAASAGPSTSSRIGPRLT